MKLEINSGNQRIGQRMFNFLEWLAVEKVVPPNQSMRLADPFFIQDEDLLKYWNEYVNQ